MLTTATYTVDKSLLIDKLTIERESAARPKSSGNSLAIAGAIVAVLVTVVWLWYDTSAAKVPPAGNLATRNVEQVSQHEPLLATPQQASKNALTASILDAAGYVVARQSATVSSKTTGKVVEVLIEEGMAVQQGDIIARLDDSTVRARLALSIAELDAAKAAALELEAHIRRKQLDVKRSRTLVQKQLVSQSNFDNSTADLDTLIARSDTAKQVTVVSARKVDIHQVALADLEIRAPFSGVVINKSAQPGEMISPVSAGGGFTRTGIGTIVDMDSLEVEVDVNETYINRISQNQAVDITLNAYPKQTYEGQVLAVIPTADRNKATIRVRVRFLLPDQRVLPEMGVRVAFLDR